MAGLPKSGRQLLLVASLLFITPCLAAAQMADLLTVEERTPSGTLQSLIDAANSSTAAAETQKAELAVAFSDAISVGQLALDQALAMLALASWETLPDAEATTATLDAIQNVLDDLAGGSLTGDPLAALAAALVATPTPAGATNAIARAGGSEGLLAQVGELVFAGVPPGILVRVAKQSLRNDLPEDEVALALDAVGAGAEGAWGHLANGAAGGSLARYGNRERNESEGSGVDAAAEQETAGNQHGSGDRGKRG